MNDQDFERAKKNEIHVQYRDGDSFRLKRLCSVPEFYRAYAEMVCILGGAMKRQLATITATRFPRAGEWDCLEKYVDPKCSGELLWGLCGQDDFELLRHISQLGWRDVWPEANHLVAGMDRPRKALGDLGNLLEIPFTYPVVHCNSNACVSLKKRVQEGLKAMKVLSLSAKSEALIRHICDLAADGSAFLILAGEA